MAGMICMNGRLAAPIFPAHHRLPAAAPEAAIPQLRQRHQQPESALQHGLQLHGPLPCRPPGPAALAHHLEVRCPRVLSRIPAWAVKVFPLMAAAPVLGLSRFAPPEGEPAAAAPGRQPVVLRGDEREEGLRCGAGGWGQRPGQQHPLLAAWQVLHTSSSRSKLKRSSGRAVR